MDIVTALGYADLATNALPLVRSEQVTALYSQRWGSLKPATVRESFGRPSE
jgi:hypothetical protein